MTDREKLNSILRLRLLYSTEEELSALTGYQLRGNHFNRFKPFQCKAYYSWFAKECGEYTLGSVDLTRLLEQYEATSEFYKKYIASKGVQDSVRLLMPLLKYLYLGITATQGQDADLCSLYDTKNAGGRLNISILLLLACELLPTFTNKKAGNIKDIIAVR